MKELKERFTLRILFSIFILTAPGTVRSSSTPLPKSGEEPAAAEAQNPVPDSEGSTSSAPPLLKDVIRPSQIPKGNQILCSDIMPQRFKSLCINKAGIEDSLFSPETSNFSLHRFQEPSTRLLATLGVIPCSEPLVAERWRSAYKIWQGLDRNQVVKILNWEEKADYFIAVKESSSRAAMGLSRTREKFRKEEAQTRPEADQRLFDLLGWLHKTGFVAINFYLKNSDCFNNVCPQKLDELDYMVRMGEPVGKLPFDPVLTDPVVLGSDGTLPADPAADYYVFGIHLLMNIHHENSRSLDDVRNLVLDMKNDSKFQFPAKTPVHRAFLICCLLQNDRAARTNLTVLSDILHKVIENPKDEILSETMTYDPKDDPLTLPQFLTAAKMFTRQVGPRRTPGWLIPVVAGGGILLLILVLYFSCRKRPSDQVDPVEINKELDQPSRAEP